LPIFDDICQFSTIFAKFRRHLPIFGKNGVFSLELTLWSNFWKN
jgi:hypothetical protein